MTKVCQVSEISDVIDSLHKTPSYVEVGIPMLRVTDIKTGSVSTDACKLVDDETFREFSKRYTPSEGDIVITRVGSYGNVAYVVDSHFCLGQNTAAIVPKNISPRYLYYVLSSPFCKAEIENLVVGSTQKTLSLKAINSLPVPRHGVAYERAIAFILGTLDDKIELNQKMNQTLEEITKTLFKSWFVDFDPVRAKTEGRSTNLPPEISDLFPDELVESEIGEIPKGWEYVPMSYLTDVMTRGIAPIYTEDKTYPVINQKCIRNSDINFELCKFTKYKKNIEQKFLKPFDILVNSMGVGTLGRVSLFVNYETNVTVDGLITVVRGITESESLFLYQHLSSRESEIINLSTGTTGQTSLKLKDLGELKVVRPSQALLNIFADTTRDMHIQKRTNTIENSTLTAIRDTLLPKLISGELRIPDEQRFLEEASI